MKVHECANCGHAVYFQNSCCVACNTLLAFDPWSMSMQTQSAPLCRNGQQHQACNWLASDTSADGFCIACDLNRTIPDLTDPRNLALWQKLQLEKNRLVYSLLRFRLPVISQHESLERGLAFDFLNADAEPDNEVMTGHARGVITLNISEADDAHREAVRQSLGEPYRTLLGHFRHESAHYYWDLLVSNTQSLDTVRAVFGDDRADYGESLQLHYQQGAPENWQENFISGYASAHPWEDWAETWAHYFHIVDALESASALGLSLDPTTGRRFTAPDGIDFDPYTHGDVAQLIDRWLPVSEALNMLNRSLGLADAYPFILSQTVIHKLQTVRNVIAAGYNADC